jgi:ABC-type phosphate/phosphonate transport system substrate-binding protein
MLLIIVLIAAGCGGNNDAKPTQTRRPPTITPTATPRSTALPPGSDASPLGSRARPIDVLIAVPSITPDDDAEEIAANLQRYLRNELSDQLLSELGVPVENATVNVTFATSSQAFQAICGQPETGNATLVWTDAFTFAAAQAQCEVTPTLALLRENDRRSYVGRSVDIVSRAEINSLSELSGQTLCRIDAQDFSSWILLGIILASEGIEPQLDLLPARDYPNSAAMVQAIYTGECAAAAIPPGELNDILEEVINSLDEAGQAVTLEELQAAIKVLSPAGNTEAPANFENWQGYDPYVVPYEVLVFPSDTVIPAATRNLINDLVYDFFKDREDGEARLGDLFEASDVIQVQPFQFQAFETLLVQGHWDMALAN